MNAETADRPPAPPPARNAISRRRSNRRCIPALLSWQFWLLQACCTEDWRLQRTQSLPLLRAGWRSDQRDKGRIPVNLFLSQPLTCRTTGQQCRERITQKALLCSPAKPAAPPVDGWSRSVSEITFTGGTELRVVVYRIWLLFPCVLPTAGRAQNTAAHTAGVCCSVAGRLHFVTITSTTSKQACRCKRDFAAQRALRKAMHGLRLACLLSIMSFKVRCSSCRRTSSRISRPHACSKICCDLVSRKTSFKLSLHVTKCASASATF